MSFAIEVTVGTTTYHYGSLNAFREDMQKRNECILSLNRFVMKDGISSKHATRLGNMCRAEIAKRDAINNAVAELNRKLYA